MTCLEKNRNNYTQPKDNTTPKTWQYPRFSCFKQRSLCHLMSTSAIYRDALDGSSFVLEQKTAVSKKVWHILSTWHATTFASTDLFWVVGSEPCSNPQRKRPKHEVSLEIGLAKVSLVLILRSGSTTTSNVIHGKINVINYVELSVCPTECAATVLRPIPGNFKNIEMNHKSINSTWLTVHPTTTDPSLLPFPSNPWGPRQTSCCPTFSGPQAALLGIYHVWVLNCRERRVKKHNLLDSMPSHDRRKGLITMSNMNV